MKKLPAVLLLAALGGCSVPVDELRARPAVWTAVYPVRFDAMANCLAVRTAEYGWQVTPQLYQQERRALMTGGTNAGIFFEYSVRQISETDTEVSYRSVHGFAAEIRKTREHAERCARDRPAPETR